MILVLCSRLHRWWNCSVWPQFPPRISAGIWLGQIPHVNGTNSWPVLIPDIEFLSRSRSIISSFWLFCVYQCNEWTTLSSMLVKACFQFLLLAFYNSCLPEVMKQPSFNAAWTVEYIIYKVDPIVLYKDAKNLNHGKTAGTGRVRAWLHELGLDIDCLRGPESPSQVRFRSINCFIN